MLKGPQHAAAELRLQIDGLGKFRRLGLRTLLAMQHSNSPSAHGCQIWTTVEGREQLQLLEKPSVMCKAALGRATICKRKKAHLQAKGGASEPLWLQARL